VLLVLHLTTTSKLATEHGPGTRGWVEAHQAGVPLAEDAAGLQAVSAALGNAVHAGPCREGCGCAAALAAPGNHRRRRFQPRTTAGCRQPTPWCPVTMTEQVFRAS